MRAKNIYLAAEGSAKDWKEAILLCGEHMMDQGMINREFINACIEREREYPTGLPSDIPVAIPHSKVDGIYQNCICFLRLNHPVRFYRMDDSEEYVETRLIFNLAIQEADAHLEFLQRLMKLVLDKAILNQCERLPLEAIPSFLESELG